MPEYTVTRGLVVIRAMGEERFIQPSTFLSSPVFDGAINHCEAKGRKTDKKYPEWAKGHPIVAIAKVMMSVDTIVKEIKPTEE